MLSAAVCMFCVCAGECVCVCTCVYVSVQVLLLCVRKGVSVNQWVVLKYFLVCVSVCAFVCLRNRDYVCMCVCVYVCVCS